MLNSEPGVLCDKICHSLISVQEAKTYVSIFKITQHLMPEWNPRQRATLLLSGVVIILFCGLILTICLLRPLFSITYLVLIVLGIVTYQRKQFLGPSSIWLQSRLVAVEEATRSAWKQDQKAVIISILRRHPLTGSIPPIAIGLIGFQLTQLPQFQIPLWNITPPFGAGLLRASWQVYATITGFSFVVLVFYWDYLTDRHSNPSLIETNIRYTWASHLIVFLISGIAVLGWLTLYAQENDGIYYIGTAGVLFIASIVAVLLIYFIIYNEMTSRPLDNRVKNEIRVQMQKLLKKPTHPTWYKIISDQVGERYPRGPVASFGHTNEHVFTAKEVKTLGEVTDIHEKRLESLFETASDAGVQLKQLPELGQRYTRNNEIFVYEGQIPDSTEEELLRQLRKMVKTSQ